MTSLLSGGLLMVLGATVYVFDIVRRKGPRFEYAMAAFLGEFGLMIVSGQVFPTADARVAATILFGLAMMAIAATWWKLFRRYQQQQTGERQRASS